MVKVTEPRHKTVEPQSETKLDGSLQTGTNDPAVKRKELMEAARNPTHTLRGNETIFGIAQKRGVAYQELLKLNGLTEESARYLREGTKLQLPVTPRTASNDVQVGNSDHRDSPRSPKHSEMPVVHHVKRGETLYSIARQHGIKPEVIAKENGLKDLNHLSIGQDLKIPGTHVQSARGNKVAEPTTSTAGEEPHVTHSNKPSASLREFEKEVKGTPYKTPAPFCRTKPEADQKKYDCLTLVLKYLGEKGVAFERGRTNAGDKVLKDHLQAYAHLELTDDHKGLVCTDKKTGQPLSRGAIKEGDIVLVGHKYSKAEGGFSVYHLGIVKYERDERGEVKKGSDGEPLLYMIHANSTGKYGQERGVIQTGIRTYLAQRADDGKRSAENRSHYAEILICRVKPESMHQRPSAMVADNAR